MPVYLVIVIVLVVKAFLFVGIFFCVTFIVGIFPYTFELICDADCPLSLVLVIFYPFVMFVGIGRAFADFFCETSGNVFQSLC